MIKFLAAMSVFILTSVAGVGITGSQDIELLMTHSLDGPVTHKSINSLIRILENTEHPLITTNSPGGSGDAFRDLLLFLRYNDATFDTYTSKSTASAGALLWTLGETRIIEPDATVTYHGVHLGTYGLTEKTVCNANDFLNSVRGKTALQTVTGQGYQAFATDPDTTFKDLKQMETLLKLTNFTGLAGVEQLADAICTSLIQFNDLQVKLVADELGLDEIYVRNVMFKGFTKDVVFTGQELYDMGIAHQLGR